MEFPVIKFDVHGILLSVMDFPKSLEGWVAFQIAAAASTRCKTKTVMLAMLAKDAELIIRSVQRGSPPQTPSEVNETLSHHAPGMPLAAEPVVVPEPPGLWAAGTCTDQGAVVNVVCLSREEAIKHCSSRMDFIHLVRLGELFSETEVRLYPLANCEVRKAYPKAESPQREDRQQEPPEDSAAIASVRITPAQQVALDWVRKEQLPEVGFVVFWEGKAIGWERNLCPPSKWRPNTVLVNVGAPIVRRSDGGDDDSGAARWLDVSEEFAYGDDEIAKGGAA